MDNLTNPNAAPVAGDLVRYSDGGFIYEHSWSEPPTVAEQAAAIARQWRDTELKSTDQAAQTPDWPNRSNILLYRAALRGWPTAKDSDDNALFPDTRPELATD